jgi:transcriptional regulator with XRE-family HTH domain
MYQYLMSTSSTLTRKTATERRTLRRLRALLVEQFAPPVCARIRAKREAVRQEALARGDKDKARDYTQEGMARRLHLSLRAYRAYEKDREPSYSRRLAIARSLGLPSDYFETVKASPGIEEMESLRQELAAVRGEMAGLHSEVADLRKSLPASRPRPAKKRRAS